MSNSSCHLPLNLYWLLTINRSCQIHFLGHQKSSSLLWAHLFILICQYVTTHFILYICSSIFLIFKGPQHNSMSVPCSHYFTHLDFLPIFYCLYTFYAPFKSHLFEVYLMLQSEETSLNLKVDLYCPKLLFSLI